jgi:dihydrolipoamide dehydrogenase
LPNESALRHPEKARRPDTPVLRKPDWIRVKAPGREIKVGKFPFIGNGKAIALGEPEGLVKTIFDAKTGELLGAHMVGAEVTELIQGYTIAKTLETTEAELMATVFPHPTLSEMMHESVLAAYGRTLHF